MRTDLICNLSPLEIKLFKAEKSLPSFEMKKFNKEGLVRSAWITRQELLQAVERIKRLHREIIFGDSPDVMINPVLDKENT